MSENELKDRLKKALSVRNMKPIELSEKTGIPKSAISQYMSGYTKPKQDRVYLISKALDINEAWLLGFDVPMEKQNTNEPLTTISTENNEILKLIENTQKLTKTINFLNTNKPINLNDTHIKEISKSLKQFQEAFNSPEMKALKKMADMATKQDESLLKAKATADTLRQQLDKALKSPLQQQLLSNFNKLNDLGQNKILEDIEDLTSLPKYQKEKEEPSGDS